MNSRFAVALALSCILCGAVPAMALEGDAVRGKDIYSRCLACHSIDANLVGPKHRGLFGRKAGSLPDYEYSAALKKSGIRWDEASLDHWIQDPNKLVPGNKMFVRLVPEAQQRADLIAYLKQATASEN